MKQRVLEELYQKGRSGNYVCVRGIVLEKRGDLIVPVGELYKNHHYRINKNLSTVIRYKRGNLEIISNQALPKEPASIIGAYINDAITKRELLEDFFKG